MQAYLPAEKNYAGITDNSLTIDGLVKIPYRIFVGGIAFNVSRKAFSLFL